MPNKMIFRFCIVGKYVHEIYAQKLISISLFKFFLTELLSPSINQSAKVYRVSIELTVWNDVGLADDV